MKASLFLSIASLATATQNHGGAQKTEKSYMAMNPEHVAGLLHDTQQEWVSFAMNEKSDIAEKEMVDSCAIVAQGMVDGSDGDKERVEEYFREVCSVGKGAQQDNCQNFAEGLLAFLTNDPEANRNSLDSKSFCTKFWSEHMSTYVQAAEARRAAEAQKEREDHEKILAAQKRAVELAKERAQEETKRQDAMRLANMKRNTAVAEKKDVKPAGPTAEQKAENLKKQMKETEKKIQNAGATSAMKVEGSAKTTAAKKETVEKKVKTFGEIASDKFRNFVSYYFTRSTTKKFQTKTMADVFRKESSYLIPRGHDVHIKRAPKFLFGSKKTIAKKSKKALTPEEQVKEEAKAIVAEKVAAIKKRIAMKFAAAAKEKKRSPQLKAKEGVIRKIEKSTNGLGDLSLR